jgi:hypothetical protein
VSMGQPRESLLFWLGGSLLVGFAIWLVLTL